MDAGIKQKFHVPTRSQNGTYFTNYKLLGACENSSLPPQEQLKLTLDRLQQGLIHVGYMTFANLLQDCSSLRLLSEGKRVHAQLVRKGLDSDRFLSNLLIGMYSKCGSLEDARRVFDKMNKRNVVSWNTIITGYAENGQGQEALKLFREMEQEGVRPSKITFICCLNACCSQEALAEGVSIHKLIIESGYESDLVVGTAVAKMYGKFRSLKEARLVFDKLPHRNVISWNTLIAAYAQHGHFDEVVKLIDQMKLDSVKPDKVTFITALNAFSSSEVLAEAKQMHAHIKSDAFDKDITVANALLNMYWKCGAPAKVRSVFDEMPERDVISWNSVIAAYAEGRKEAFNLFGSLQWSDMKPDTITFVNLLNACCSPAILEDGKALHASIIACGFDINVVLGNALVSMYGKCGSAEDAFCVFSKILHPDLVSWNGMIGAYAQNGCEKEALQLFQCMQSKGIRPDKVTFVVIVDSCASMAALKEGRLIHQKIMDHRFEGDVVVGTALINMYSQSGSLDEARKAFDQIFDKNVATWNAMIGSYAQHGRGKEALQLFWEMQNEQVKPDKVTFVGLLSACSHAGLVDEGRYFFRSLRSEYGLSLTTEHYGCMVDLFGRAGQLKEAEDLLLNMPLPPNDVLWLTLLGACRKHGDAERGKRAAEHVLKLDPKNNAAKVVLSNIYAAAERWDDAADVRGGMINEVL
ncbi:hypothetical protein O6H91_21G071800 [Diphasiastrum complanatum]|uniref:Uncharacterized protein n=1 Tax=Diphasiastrum complanatum TaxID=34168 RepID=A0ACC2ALP8_DIPCM|nr:hypothetical protein O6H91_21G071800 [Diphasiastrum complanatum]